MHWKQVCVYPFVIIDLTVYMQVRTLTLDQKRNTRVKIYKSGITTIYNRLEITISYLTSSYFTIDIPHDMYMYC